LGVLFNAINATERAPVHRFFFALKLSCIMKNFAFGLMLTSIVSLVACKKDGGFANQIIGQWQSTTVKVADSDVSAANSIMMVIENTNEFEATIEVKPAFGPPTKTVYTGEWSADEEKKEILFTYDNGSKEKYDVTEITDTNMKAVMVLEGIRREFVFEKQ
jgi:hypothetical protein